MENLNVEILELNDNYDRSVNSFIRRTKEGSKIDIAIWETILEDLDKRLAEFED